MATTTFTSQQQPDILTPLIAPLSTPFFQGGLALLILCLILSTFTKRRPELSDGRFATAAEVRAGRHQGLRQIARQKHNEAALSFGRLILPDLQPAVSIVGGSGSGKTRSIIDPGLKSAIDQEWTLMVLDVKGNLMQKHAPYAHAKGYDVYAYAPGFAYSDGLNFSDFMHDSSDAKAAQENASVLNCNFQEPGTKQDPFFGPQGISLLRLVLMLAKHSPYPDLLTAWKILSLENLAGRLAAAKQYGLFNFDGALDSWIGEAAVALRSVAHAEETSVGIVGSAVTHFQTLVDRSILPCLLKSTLPLDLPGKQIIFFQVDEQSEAATSPLVAAAIHMLVKRNLNATVKRDRPLGLFLDEFSSIRLPDIEAWINRFREYGMVCLLSYQSDAQTRMRYSRDYVEAILSSCKTKIVFNTGHPETAEKVSASLGQKDVWYDAQSRSYGKNSNRSTAEHVQKVPLVSAPALNRMDKGECVIMSPGFDYRPHKLRVPLNRQDDTLWSRCTKIWDQEICPTLIEQTEQRLEGVSLDVELSDRDVIAQTMLPTAEELEALKNVRELRARSGAVT
ncbi:Type IV secretory pathway, VirD4 components [uncultured Synechococcales cyanobacterium]|uniref:Type IV secretory pathway, VirD4 components n=1 Tax=uncultured Synechococcales cyanobacterium TaxID=1936017 RepID=A0A6J4V270_9CYAN|nr:Type IV secretory pathway, VirD4 components [uncultured Synechococcales cyanobacterium]